MDRLPDWAAWPRDGDAWTLGVEEEVMLLDADGWTMSATSEDVISGLPDHLAHHMSTETQASVLELQSDPRPRVAPAVAQIAGLRRELAAELADGPLRAAVAGTHPFAEWRDIEVTPAERHEAVHRAMRELARREPTMALHVHVGVPDPEDAVRALNAMRRDAALLLALSASSPFWQGRDSGLASARTTVFGAFPRTGMPRRFEGYADWVAAVDTLMACTAFPDHTHLWWDVRLQPALGTVEVRIMDAQTDVADVAPLVALVQCLVRRAVLDEDGGSGVADLPELVHENGFLAARDGMRAEFLVPGGRCVPARELLERTVEAVGPHAEALGCRDELAETLRLAGATGADRQRERAREPDGIRGLAGWLAERFVAPAPAGAADVRD